MKRDAMKKTVLVLIALLAFITLIPSFSDARGHGGNGKDTYKSVDNQNDFSFKVSAEQFRIAEKIVTKTKKYRGYSKERWVYSTRYEQYIGFFQKKEKRIKVLLYADGDIISLHIVNGYDMPSTRENIGRWK